MHLSSERNSGSYSLTKMSGDRSQNTESLTPALSLAVWVDLAYRIPLRARSGTPAGRRTPRALAPLPRAHGMSTGEACKNLPGSGTRLRLM